MLEVYFTTYQWRASQVQILQMRRMLDSSNWQYYDPSRVQAGKDMCCWMLDVLRGLPTPRPHVASGW